jgi:hypothetical protein
MPDPQDHLDLLIDTALSTYAEPRTGLEARVLANLSAPHTRRRWLPFAIALPIAACLLLLLLYPRHPRTEPVHQAQHSPAPQIQAGPQNSIAQAAHTPSRQPQPRVVAARIPRTQPTPLPKLDVFPTPQPLTPEEQALVHFVTPAPPSEIQSLEEAQKKKDEPLHIAEIQIPPLEQLNKTDKPGN